MKLVHNTNLFEESTNLEKYYTEIRKQAAHPYPETPYFELFRRIAEKYPEKQALITKDGTLHYQDLFEKACQIGSALKNHGFQKNARIGFLLPRSTLLVAGALACLKEGFTFVPIDQKHRQLAKKHILEVSDTECLFASSNGFSDAISFLWDCPDLKLLICTDSNEFWNLEERSSERMDIELWDQVGSQAFDEISGGGWKSIYTGKWLKQVEMDEYRQNAGEKLSQILKSKDKVLEIGCGSGITTFEIASKVSHILATDLSNEILQFAMKRGAELGIDNVNYLNSSTDGIDEIEGVFDVIVMNSVVQSFHGYIYLKKVIDRLINKLPEEGYIFIGNVWDAELKEAYYSSINAYRNEKKNGAVQTYGDMFFVHKNFFRYLKKTISCIASIELSTMLSESGSELSEFSYDVVIRVHKTQSFKTEKEQIVGSDFLYPTEYSKKYFPCEIDKHEAYIIFTSGSTGQPKGVSVSEKSMLNLLHWYKGFCGMHENSTILHAISPSFDASVKNMLVPFIIGARSVLFHDNGVLDPAELLTVIEQESVTHFNPGVPSIVYPMVDLAEEKNYKELESLCFLALGGEHPNMSKLRKWMLSENCQCITANIYGPTEFTDIALARIIQPDEWHKGDNPPIGFPISNNHFYVLDKDKNLVPEGKAGELCLGGRGASNGYLKLSDLDTEKFIKDPLLPEHKAYLTGDLVVYNTNLGISYLGRVDNQVKIRGHRIELSAIENQTLMLPEIQEAIVKNHSDTLAIHAVSKGRTEEFFILDHLRRTLPEYMIPSHVIFHEKIPKKVNGKVDYFQLKLPDLKQTTWVAPKNQLECSLMEIWEKILQNDTVSTDVSFFKLGGHSLLVASLVSHIKRKLQIHFPLTLIYKFDTIQLQSKWITSRKIEKGHMTKLSDGERILLAFPPISGLGIVFQSVASELQDTSLIATDFNKGDDIIGVYVKQILESYDQKEFSLLGYSAGCTLACKVAMRLEEKGRVVQNLILVDGLPPESARYSEKEAEEIARITVKDQFGASPKETQQEMYEYVLAYGLWLSQQTFEKSVTSPVHFLASKDTEEWAADAWKESLNMHISTYKAKGNHLNLFDNRNSRENAKLIERILNNED